MNSRLNEGVMNAVEEQLNNPECLYVEEHFNRLKEMGYSESGAKKLIASALLNEMKEIVKYKREFDESTYIENLEKLPDKPWLEKDSDNKKPPFSKKSDFFSQGPDPPWEQVAPGKGLFS